MRQIAERMKDIPFSSIRTIFERVGRLEQSGKEVIHLEVGRPDFDTPNHIKQAAIQALNNGHVHYTSNFGIQPLREAIAQKLAVDNQLSFDPKTEIIVTSGVSEGIVMTMMALLNPEDEVLILEPVFPCYIKAARMAGAIPITVPVNTNDYLPTRADLESRVSKRTKMLVVTTPGNPSGVVLKDNTLKMLADFAISHNLLVLSDEIYEKLIYDQCEHRSIGSLPHMRDRTITLNGFSKSYAMTGWRLGYVAADAKWINALIRIHQYSMVCATSFAQWGGVVALESDQSELKKMVSAFDQRRQLVIKKLSQIQGLKFIRPQGAMYVYIDVSQLTADAYRFASELLEQMYVAVVPWNAQHLRLAYGNSYDNIATALERLQTFVNKSFQKEEIWEDTEDCVPCF